MLRHRVVRSFIAVLVLAAAGFAAEKAIQPKAGHPVVIRDRYGIPHIYAANEADGAWAFGYCQAEDALPTLLQVFMEAKGRSAAMPGGNLERDTRLRIWQFEANGREAYGKLDPDSRQLLDSFVAGINAFIREHPDEMPSWASPVTPADVLALTQMVSIGFDLQLPRPLPPTGTNVKEGDGSNWFALSGKRTATGNPILSIDPHLQWAGAMRWYEAHIKAGGMHVAGATLIGNPVLTLGHNENFAWSMTIAPATGTTVLYEEKLNPKNPGQYWDGDKWVDMRVVKETFKSVKPEDKGGTTQEFRYTRNGPVVRVDLDKHRALVARYGAWQSLQSLAQFRAMARATTLNEYRRATSNLSTPTVNLLYADVRGNLFYRLSAQIPVRPDRAGAVLEGWNPQQAWQGILPESRLPQALNPPAGYLQSGNDASWFVTSRGVMRPDNHPPYVQPVFETWRGRRLTNLLNDEKGKTSIERARQIATDTFFLPAEHIKPLILAAYQNGKAGDKPGAAELEEAVEVLRSWNNHMDVDQPGASLMALVMKMGQDAPANIPRSAVTEVIEKWGADKGPWLLERLRASAQALKADFGSVKVPYGQIHRYSLGGKDLPLPGLESFTLRAAGGPIKGTRMQVMGGSSFSMLVDLRAPVRAVSILPYGNSHRASSKHYNDQMELYAQRQYKPAWFTDADVLANQVSRRELKVAGAAAAAAGR